MAVPRRFTSSLRLAELLGQPVPRRSHSPSQAARPSVAWGAGAADGTDGRLTGLAAPPAPQVMAGAIESESFEEERQLNERETMTWKPRKGKPKVVGQNKAECLLKNIPGVLDSESEESEFSDISHNESDTDGFPARTIHAHSDLEDLDGEVSSLSVAVTYPELQTAAVHEVEDWDKELEDYNPYDAGDFHCGSFQENNPLASYSWQDDSFYIPGCHHAASLAFTPPFRMTEAGQFDDADE